MVPTFLTDGRILSYLTTQKELLSQIIRHTGQYPPHLACTQVLDVSITVHVLILWVNFLCFDWQENL